MFKMEIGGDVKRDNGAGAADKKNVRAQRETQTPASVLTHTGGKEADRDRDRDRDRARRKDRASFQRQRISSTSDWHHVGAELGRQRGRKAFSPGGGGNKKSLKRRESRNGFVCFI